MSCIIKLKRETLITTVYYRALKRFLALFPEKEQGWIDKCQERLCDVVYLGFFLKKKSWRHEFILERNTEIDKSNSKARHYRIYIYGEKNGFCSCYFGKYGKTRMLQICTHRGTCTLMLLYLDELKKEVK